MCRRETNKTFITQDALGGNCKTVMIANIAPASFQFEESKNTLLYADRAKKIKMKVSWKGGGSKVYSINSGVVWHTGKSSRLQYSRSPVRFPAGPGDFVGLSCSVSEWHTTPVARLGWFVVLTVQTLSFHQCSYPVIICEFVLPIPYPPW